MHIRIQALHEMKWNEMNVYFLFSKINYFFKWYNVTELYMLMEMYMLLEQTFALSYMDSLSIM